ncbi:MAG TPA: Rnase Y domain-containing protein, partial [Kofleriaceae bacterium]|nr:Rnase Y domain-containing protein [Kofleriaceae bacterium]
MEALYVLAAVVIGLVGGVFVGTRLGRAKGDTGAAREAAAEEADKIRKAAQAEIEAIKKAAEVEGKEVARKHKSELDDELRGRRSELQKREEGVAAMEREVEKQRRDAE